MLLAACTLPAADGDRTGSAAASCQPGEKLGTSEAGLEQIGLCVESDGKSHAFTVEVAKTPPEQARGMMFRTELADDAGMFFPYDKPEMLSFWMKNTFIPLDIIFIRQDGSIESIAANAIPHSLESIPSGEPAIAVLEIRGGLAGELGIEPGDRVKWAQ